MTSFLSHVLVDSFSSLWFSFLLFQYIKKTRSYPYISYNPFFHRHHNSLSLSPKPAKKITPSSLYHQTFLSKKHSYSPSLPLSLSSPPFFPPDRALTIPASSALQETKHVNLGWCQQGITRKIVAVAEKVSNIPPRPGLDRAV